MKIQQLKKGRAKSKTTKKKERKKLNTALETIHGKWEREGKIKYRW